MNDTGRLSAVAMQALSGYSNGMMHGLLMSLGLHHQLGPNSIQHVPTPSALTAALTSSYVHR